MQIDCAQRLPEDRAMDKPPLRVAIIRYAFLGAARPQAWLTSPAVAEP